MRKLWIVAGLLLGWAGLLAAPPAGAQPVDVSLTPLPLDDLSAFRPAADNWRVAGGVAVEPGAERTIAARPGRGVLVNVPDEGARDNLFTTWEHGDLAIEMEVLLPAGSNSGVYLQGRYEVQLFDSWGVRRPGFADMGGIYERWDDGRPRGREGFEGIAPLQNASRMPGLWQRLEIDFRAPRFDAEGRKVEHARFERVALNGVVIHENVAVTGPTRAAAFEDERPAGPLMIQGDHGPVAFRRIRYKRFGEEPVRLSGIRYATYEGAFDAMPDFAALTPARQGAVEGFRHDLFTNREAFATSYDGTIHIPTSGRYRFLLDFHWRDGDPHLGSRSTGGGVFRVGDAVVLRHDGLRRRAEGSVRLEAGTHPFSLAYYKNQGWGSPVVVFAAEGPDTPPTVLNAAGSHAAPPAPDPILVEPGREPVVLRSMVELDGEKRTHAVSVGDPAGVHYALDLARGALLKVWRGPFVDATPMWHSRGTDQLALPRGSAVSLGGAPPLAALASASSAWPEAAPEAFRFGGYELDDEGRPTFHYTLGGVAVTDRLDPALEGRALHRTLTVRSDGGAPGLWHLVASGARIESRPDGAYRVDDAYDVALDPDAPADPVVRTRDGRQELVLPLGLDGGRAQVGYTLLW